MKKRKLLLSTLIALGLLTTMTGCGQDNKKGNTNNDKKTEEKNKMKGKCTAVDCMKQIEINSTIEQINEIKAEFTRSKIADKNVDLSKSEELKAKVNAGINYEQFKAEIGNVEGIIVEKSEDNTRYMWVSKKGGYIRANFRNRDNICTFFTGMTDRK